MAFKDESSPSEGQPVAVPTDTVAFTEPVIAPGADASARDAAKAPSAPGLDEAQRRIVLEVWNRTARPYERDGTIHGVFEMLAGRYGARTAVAFGMNEMTYGELNRRSNQLAHHLRKLGVGRGGLVGVWMDRSLELVVSLLAILKAGGGYVPLDPSYPNERLHWMLEDSGLNVVLTQEAMASSIPASDRLQVVRVDSQWTEVAGQSAENPEPPVGAEDVAYVIYTSGSTGRPKGSIIPHRGVLRLVRGADYVVLGAETVALQLAPVSFDASTLELWGPLLNGGRCALFAGRIPTASELGKALEVHNVNLLWLTSSLYNAIIDEAPEVLRGVKQLLIGGEALSVPHVRRGLEQLPTTQIINGYGPTEGTTFTCCHRIPRRLDEQLTSVPIGRPISNTRVYILDPEAAPVAVGAWGELYIGGDGLAIGYLNRPELTAEKFVPDPFVPGRGARLYRTGDICRHLPDGTIEFRGRFDDQVKIRGFRIELGEIESVLRGCAGVKDCVVTVRGEGGDKRLVGYVVPDLDSRMQVTTAVTEARISHWKRQYDEVLYATATVTDAAEDPRFNFAGWVSNYTGLPISEDEMLEQLDQTVGRVEVLAPLSVLEIGCGTGLLLFRLAERCDRYVGTDFSSVALDYIRGHLQPARLPQVELLQCRADDFSAFGRSRFDLILLNSVVQYFSDIGYLLRVLESAVGATSPGGCVFIGDVRNSKLLKALHTSIQFFQAPSSLSLGQLRQRVLKHLELDAELAVDPGFFLALRHHLPRITHVEIRPKRGRLHNEFTRFRYDVLLHVEREVSEPAPVRMLQWGLDVQGLEDVRSIVRGAGSAQVRICNIPNARTAEERFVMAAMDDPREGETVGDLRKRMQDASRGLDPEDCLDLGGEAVGGTLTVDWSRSDASGSFDLEVEPGTRLGGVVVAPMPTTAGALGPALDWASYANDPLRAAATRKLVPELRVHLESRLPDYMVPSSFVLMEKLPVTANGKVDRNSLPPPSLDRPELSNPYEPPSTPVEESLVALWQKVLGLRMVGIHDNFFSLGGDSIQAMIIISVIQKKLGEVVHVIVLFDAPTVAQLAAYLDQHYKDAAARLGDRASSRGSDRLPATSRIHRRITAADVAQLRGVIQPLPPRPAPAASRNRRAIFLLCPPRSGSTLLRVLLAGHPSLFAPPELELLGFNTLAERRLAHAGKNDFLLEGTIRALMELRGCDVDEARRIQADCEKRGMTTQQFYQVLQDDLSDRTLVDKTPTYSLDPATLHRAEQDFDEPLYIHLARHPYGMIRSFEEAKMDQVFFRYPHPFSLRELGELTWIVSQENILRFLEGVPAGRQIRIRFEDLVTRQKEVMEAICTFLNLDFRPGMLQPYKEKKTRMTDGTHPLARGLVDVKFTTHDRINPAVADLWRQEYQNDFLSDIGWELAASLGYPRSAFNPPAE